MFITVLFTEDQLNKWWIIYLRRWAGIYLIPLRLKDSISSSNYQYLFSQAPKITVDSDCSHEMKRCLLLERKAMTYLDTILKSRDISQSYVFSSSHVWMWELKHKEGWVSTKELMLSNCGAGEDSSWVPWTARRSNQSILNQPWIFTGMTDAEAEAPILRHLM